MVTPDLPDLAARLAAAGVHDPRPLPGGASSLTYVADRGGERVVVKVAPPGLPPVLHRDVLRQARVMRALAGSDVPVAEVRWEDAGAPPDVPPLFIMSFLAGDSLEPLFDLGPAGSDPSVIAARLRDAARVLARLHVLSPESLCLQDEPVGNPGDEVDRWCHLLETVDQALVPGWQITAALLRRTEPPATGPAVVHGDFRLGNLLAVDDRVTAVIDWEIWSVGDPRLDLGWFLLNADPTTYRRATPYVGLTPSPEELATEYASALGARVDDLAWFLSLAAFKSAATWSLIVKHNRRRAEPDPEHEAMAAVLPSLLERARRELDA